MFAYTHIYYTQHSEKFKNNNLLILGSILPDLALTGIIGWEDLHKKETESLDFEKFINKNYPPYSTFTQGIRRHNELDYVTHIDYKDKIGFAYQFQTPELVALVKIACGVNDGDKARIKAHNFLKTAVEINILKNNPELFETLKNAIEQTDSNELSQIIADYFQINKNTVKNKITDFLELHTNYNLSQETEWLLMWNELNNYFFQHDVDKESTKKAITMSLEIVTPLYKEFIDTALAKHKI